MQNFVSRINAFTHGLKQFFCGISSRKEYKSQEDSRRQESARGTFLRIEEGNCTRERNVLACRQMLFPTFSLGFLFPIALILCFIPHKFASSRIVLYETIPREQADYTILFVKIRYMYKNICVILNYNKQINI